MGDVIKWYIPDSFKTLSKWTKEKGKILIFPQPKGKVIVYSNSYSFNYTSNGPVSSK
jgi:hypothetical protein